MTGATGDDLVCGILDHSAMETITGDLVVVADGEMVPAAQRKKGSECEVVRNGRLLLAISLRDFEDEADRTAAVELPHCTLAPYTSHRYSADAR